MSNQIEIGGKLRPVKYGINALAEFNQGTGTDLQWILLMLKNPLSMDLNHVRWLAYVGLKMGAKENNENIDFNVETVGDWLNTDFNKLPLFINALAESMPQSDGKKK